MLAFIGQTVLQQRALLNVLRRILAILGILSFASKEFQEGCNFRGIISLSAAQYHPATNGVAERFVQTFKKEMRKSGSNLDRARQEFLSQYRSTPGLSGTSPSEMLFKMQIWSLVDTFHQTDKPKTNDYPVLPSKYSFVKLNNSCYFKNLNLKEERSPRGLLVVIIKIVGNRHVLLKLRNSKVIKRHVEKLRPRYPTNDSDFMLNYPFTKQEDYQTAPRPNTK
ncbi:hypothetical protein RF11_11270 [Thelohanellus kitauei]|uniref:Integrase catalytic domain-containing protein n=1 Tax=Thelohanellus kitauei TaxID=669202 RepID=A0A0C2M2A9_THEKT|nr:hypothetical protein RF11_11270 [Thelohanellus kitauei]